VLSITSSPPITFVVGPNQEEHTIHSALVAHQSAALNALVNGGMKESIDRRVVWNDVDEEVFIRFSQFVYTGDYDEAKPNKREVEAVTRCRATPCRDTPFQVTSLLNRPSRLVASQRVTSGQTSSRAPPAGVLQLSSIRALSGESKNVSLENKKLLWDKFQALYPSPSRHLISSPKSASYDYTDVFLSHARMYVFADCYGIDSLQTLALHKLCRALVPFDLYVETCGDVIQLIRYCFEQTIDKGGQTDKLRALVCLYTACKVEELWDNTEFRNLTKTLPDFSAGLITSVLDRLD
jgi:hypothetical protein